MAGDARRRVRVHGAVSRGIAAARANACVQTIVHSVEWVA